MQRMYAVIGAGNGGQAMAAHLTLLGYDVSLYDIDHGKIAQLQQRGSITASGQIEGSANINKITNCLGDAIAGCNAIFVTTTTDQHIALAKSLLPYIDEKQPVILCPGQTGGSIVVRNVFAEGGKNIVIAEMQDLIYTCRTSTVGHVNIPALKKKMAVAVYQKEALEQVMEVLDDIYPQLVWAKSVLHTGFDNMGAILHPAPMLMNAGRIESGENFLYYREGITPSVAAVLERMDKERLAVAEAYGVEVSSVAQWQKTAYGVDGKNLYEIFQNNASYAGVKAGTTLNSRFITEDVPCGLVPITAMGKLAGVQTPVMDSVIELAGNLMNRDFRADGRNLKCLGLEGKSVDEIRQMFFQEH